jgi:hypothetical protein
MTMADQNNIKEEITPSQDTENQPLPAVEGAEQVSETDLDDLAGGALGWVLTACTVTI